MRRWPAASAVALAVGLAACGLGDRPERRYGSSTGSTGIAASEATGSAVEPTDDGVGPVVTALTSCGRDSSGDADDVRRVDAGAHVVVRTAPDPWRWPLTDAYQRCTGTLRAGDDEPEKHSGHKWWPYEPLATTGGVSLAIGSASTEGDVLLVDDIVLRNERPTDIRLRAIRITAHDSDGDVVAAGQTGVFGVSLDEMRTGVTVERGDVDGTTLPWAIALDRVSPAVIDADRLTFDYEIHFYDRLHRITSGEMVTAFADATPSDVERSALTNEPLPPTSGAVRLRTSSDTCLTNVPYGTFTTAGEELALPFRRFGKGPTHDDPDPPFIVELEVVSWPSWDEIVKSGAVVAEVPFKDADGTQVDLDEYGALEPAGGWELCATGMRVRVIRVEPLS